MPSEVETLLLGGTANRGLVVRVGDTVRRPLRASSTATHALLKHLEQVGFTGAPTFLGIDSQGREVLSFLRGETVTAPYPAWSPGSGPAGPSRRSGASSSSNSEGSTTAPAPAASSRRRPSRLPVSGDDEATRGLCRSIPR